MVGSIIVAASTYKEAKSIFGEVKQFLQVHDLVKIIASSLSPCLELIRLKPHLAVSALL